MNYSFVIIYGVYFQNKLFVLFLTELVVRNADFYHVQIILWVVPDFAVVVTLGLNFLVFKWRIITYSYKIFRLSPCEAKQVLSTVTESELIGQRFKKLIISRPSSLTESKRGKSIGCDAVLMRGRERGGGPAARPAPAHPPLALDPSRGKFTS